MAAGFFYAGQWGLAARNAVLASLGWGQDDTCGAEATIAGGVTQEWKHSQVLSLTITFMQARAPSTSPHPQPLLSGVAVAMHTPHGHPPAPGPPLHIFPFVFVFCNDSTRAIHI